MIPNISDPIAACAVLLIPLSTNVSAESDNEPETLALDCNLDPSSDRVGAAKSGYVPLRIQGDRTAGKALVITTGPREVGKRMMRVLDGDTTSDRIVLWKPPHEAAAEFRQFKGGLFALGSNTAGPTSVVIEADGRFTMLFHSELYPERAPSKYSGKCTSVSAPVGAFE